MKRILFALALTITALATGPAAGAETAGPSVDQFTCEIRIVRTSDGEVVIQNGPMTVSAERVPLAPPTGWRTWEGRKVFAVYGMDGERYVDAYFELTYRVGLTENLSDARFYWAPWIVLSADGGAYSTGSQFPSEPSGWPKAEFVNGRVSVPESDVSRTVEHPSGYSAKASCHPTAEILTRRPWPRAN